MTKSIQQIEGIGPAFSEKLKDAGIYTTEKLLEMGGSKSGRKALAEKTSISEKKYTVMGQHVRPVSYQWCGGAIC